MSSTSSIDREANAVTLQTEKPVAKQDRCRLSKASIIAIEILSAIAIIAGALTGAYFAGLGLTMLAVIGASGVALLTLGVALTALCSRRNDEQKPRIPTEEKTAVKIPEMETNSLEGSNHTASKKTENETSSPKGNKDASSLRQLSTVRQPLFELQQFFSNVMKTYQQHLMNGQGDETAQGMGCFFGHSLAIRQPFSIIPGFALRGSNDSSRPRLQMGEETLTSDPQLQATHRDRYEKYRRVLHDKQHELKAGTDLHLFEETITSGNVIQFPLNNDDTAPSIKTYYTFVKGEDQKYRRELFVVASYGGDCVGFAIANETLGKDVDVDGARVVLKDKTQ